MIIEGCAKGVVLLLLVSSSYSQSMDDNSRTLDAAAEDPVRTSAKHRSVSGVEGRLRRSNPAYENAEEQNRPASIENTQRINEEVLEGVNATSDVKESKFFGFNFLPPSYSQCISQCLFQVAVTTVAPTTTAAPIPTTSSGICQLLAANAGITAPTALQTYLQQCAVLIGLITAPTTVAPTVATTVAPTTTAAPTTTTGPTTTAGPTTTLPIKGICEQLAANAGISEPTALQLYVQRCAVLLGLITG